MQVTNFAENKQVIEEKVEQVAATAHYIDSLQEIICVTTSNILDSLEFEEGLDYTEKLSGLKYSFYYHINKALSVS